jgi:hypothetical protein
MSGCPRLYLYARVRAFHLFAHETAGAASTRHSLRPLYSGANDFFKTSGASRRGIVELYLNVARCFNSEQFATNRVFSNRCCNRFAIATAIGALILHA